MLLTTLTDWAQNAHSLTVQRGPNAHYVASLYRVLNTLCTIMARNYSLHKCHCHYKPTESSQSL